MISWNCGISNPSVTKLRILVLWLRPPDVAAEAAVPSFCRLLPNDRQHVDDRLNALIQESKGCLVRRQWIEGCRVKSEESEVNPGEACSEREREES